ncbi:sigma-70 family RNA polymerase sigma factor [Sphingobacterium puteale]|uniref:Sigma-70 family RNA polymerase sigma factor n=1 Tax=Sphingobacterium puteale TaxID=2420510 RepID=A0A420VWC9_9SPHI|nr:sigma-70 family RNA polymerase sigma factor [Sphingobacterium puteale]RKO70555.1 sigma-70 family RNA polymerase sigma factor [Sphingobacterium puteale]
MEFEYLYKNYSGKIFRVCLGYFNDAEKAKDVMQDTFITVFTHMDELRHHENIPGWIYRIASNKCLRQIENEKKKELVKDYRFLKSSEVDPYKEEKTFIKLHQCIADLPELDRLIIGFFLEDLKQEKIAEILGITHSNVRVRIHRIKEVLSKKMKDDE